MLVFGFPDPGAINTEGLTPPGGLPLLLRTDSVVPVIGTVNWQRRAVQFHDLLGLKRVSLRVEGNMSEAGSFGGFLKASGEEGGVFGLTAAHCLPGAA